MIQPLERWSRPASVTLALLLVGFVGAADYLTGHEILFSSFYLVAVALAAWTIGSPFAVFVAVLSVGVSLVGDLAAGARYAQTFVPVWNAGIVLAFYVVVIFLLHRLRTMHRDLEVRVRQRTLALTDEIAERERLEREVLEVGERERRRIGRDLHDSLGQMLTGTALAGQVLQEKLATRGLPEAADAARIVAFVEESVELTRALARGLDPVEIEAGGLGQGLRELAARTSALAKIRCEYSAGAPVEVPDSMAATHLYRIAQEAIANAMKHGHAQRIDLHLDGLAGRVRLAVHDDGVGMPRPAARGVGMGLRIMAHRAAVMGGTLEIETGEAGGTTVTCEMPNP